MKLSQIQRLTQQCKVFFMLKISQKWSELHFLRKDVALGFTTDFLLAMSKRALSPFSHWQGWCFGSKTLSTEMFIFRVLKDIYFENKTLKV